MMRRAATLAPLAVLATACASRPWTPAVSVAYWAEEVPPTHPVGLPGAPELMQRWQLPASSPWSRYSKMTLLSAVSGAPPVAPLPDVVIPGTSTGIWIAAAALGWLAAPRTRTVEVKSTAMVMIVSKR